MNGFSAFWSNIRARRSGGKTPRIGFTDSTDQRIINVVQDLQNSNSISAFLIGNKDKISEACRRFNANSIRPDRILSINSEEQRHHFADLLHRKSSPTGGFETGSMLDDSLYQGIAFLLDNAVDGLVSGASRPTADVVRAAIQCVGPDDHHRLVAGHFLLETEHRRSDDQTPILFADCAVMPEPTPRSLAVIAAGAAQSFTFFTGKPARVALLSFSTRGSAAHALVDRIREALALIRKHEPGIAVDGELQVDAAIDPEVALWKGAEGSKVAGRANVFIFPNLESGNIGYKLVQRFARARIAGPLLWGLKKPMSDLSRGCTIEEVTDTAFCVSNMVQGLA